MNEMHVARGWFDLVFEQDCPCDKAICGMVVMGKFSPDCTSHDFTKTIRQGHSEDQCPGEDW